MDSEGLAVMEEFPRKADGIFVVIVGPAETRVVGEFFWRKVH